MTSLALPNLHPGDRVLVYYDKNDDLWHERYLAEPVGGTSWVVTTPDDDLYEEDLVDNLGVQKLGARGGVPRGVGVTGGLYRFDEAKLKRKLPKLLEEAAVAVKKLVVMPLATAAAAAPAQAASGPLVEAGGASSLKRKAQDAGRIWVFLETRGGYQRGDPVPENLIPAVEVGDRAVVELNASMSIAAGLDGTLGDIATTPRVLDDGVDDLRVFPVRYDKSRRRGRDVSDAVSMLTTTKFDDWKVRGPRTTQWLYQSFLDQMTTPSRRHYWWRSVMNLTATEPGVEEHKFLSEVLECMVTFDQINCAELMGLEHISRRYQMWEEVYAQALRESDAGGGPGTEWSDERQLILGLGRARGQALVCPDLETWVAEQIRDETVIMKERRKGREERQAARGLNLEEKPDETGKKKGPKPKAKA